MVAATLAAWASPPPSPAATGLWESARGADVFAPGAGTGYEICIVAADCKLAEADPSDSTAGRLDFPSSVAVAANGDLYVGNQGKNRIEKFDSSGQFLRAFGRDVIAGNGVTGVEQCTVASTCQGGAPGNAQGGGFQNVTSVAVGPAGQVYTADELNNRIQEFTSGGVFVRAWGYGVNGGAGFEVCTVADSCQGGSAVGTGGGLSNPVAVAVGDDGDVFVADAGNNRIQRFGVAPGAVTFKRAWGQDVDTTGGTGLESCTVAAQCKAGTPGGLGGALSLPSGIAVAGTDVYVIDQLSYRIQRFTTSGGFVSAWGRDVDAVAPGTGREVCTVAANCQAADSGGGAGEFTGFAEQSNGLALNADGDVYVADADANRIQVFSRSGSFERMFGRGVDVSTTAYTVCTTPLTCRAGTAGALGGEMSRPVGLATGPGQRVYVSDRNNARIQKFADSSAPAATFRFSSATYSAGEGAGSATITVQRTGDASGPESVGYATTAGTATAGADYTQATGRVSFAAGQTSRTFSVPIRQDTENEEGETVNVSLTAPSFAAQLGTPSAATLTIADDETGVDTQITSGPNATNSGVATFGFRAIPSAGATFECSLDGTANAAYDPCTSPHTTDSLTAGSHTFRVRAISGGTPDPTPAAKTFLVDRTSPTVKLDLRGTKTASGAFAGGVNVDATATDPAPSAGIRAKFCVVDPATPPTSFGAFGSEPCGFSVSAAGTHTVYAIANDEASNESAIVSDTFRIAPFPGDDDHRRPLGQDYSAPLFSFTGSPFRSRPSSARSTTQPYSALRLSRHSRHLAARASTPSTCGPLSPDLLPIRPRPAAPSTWPQRTQSRSCTMLVPYIRPPTGHQKSTQQTLPHASRLLPLGSVCTVNLDVDATAKDFRYDTAGDERPGRVRVMTSWRTEPLFATRTRRSSFPAPDRARTGHRGGDRRGPEPQSRLQPLRLSLLVQPNPGTGRGSPDHL